MLEDEIRYRILRLLEERPTLSQRELAQELGVSLGKAHYCLRALIDEGLVKAGHRGWNGNKVSNLYKITPTGIAEQARVTRRFLETKMVEYEALKAEIARLQGETDALARFNGSRTPSGQTSR